MNIRHSRSSLLVLFACTAQMLAPSAFAIEPIPEEQGWSGFVMFGGGFTDVESNTVVGNDIIDVGDDTISSIFQDPQSDDTAHPIVGGEVKYTLPGRSQFFLGASMEDQLTMDFANQIGWRKQMPSAGTYQIGLLFSTPALEVWADPYLEGVPRREVDRDSTGFRFEWDGVLGSGFGFLLQARDIDLDDELSGSDPALGCDTDCQQLLDRNGDQFSARFWYRFILSPNHILEPQFRIRDDDRDGAAIAHDAWAVALNYTYLQPPFTFVGSALLGQSEYDEPNPLYGIKQDEDTIAFDATLLYALPTQSGRWQAMASFFWGESDSDISFHDNEMTQVAVGFMYNFGGASKK